MVEATPLFDMSPEDFGYYLRELESTGRDPEEINFLRREYRKANTAFSGKQQDYKEGLADEGRKPIWGGFASKPEGATGWDAIRGLEFEPWGGATTLGNVTASAINAPKAAYEGTIPREDMTREALGTAGMAMTGGLGAAGRGALDFDPNQVNIFGGQKATDPGFTRSGQLAPQSMGADKLPRFEIDDSEAVVIPNNIKSFTGKEGELDKLSTVGDILIHDELFYQYPDLVDIPIGVDTTLGKGSKQNIQGYFDPGNPEAGTKPLIAISPRLLESPELKKTLVHELQHSVQEKEGFSTGTSKYSPEVAPISKALLDEYEVKKKEYNKRFSEEFSPESVINTYNDLTQDVLDAMEKEGLDVVRLIEDPDTYDFSLEYSPEARNKRRLVGTYQTLLKGINKAQRDYSSTTVFNTERWDPSYRKGFGNLLALKNSLSEAARDLKDIPIGGRLGKYINKQKELEKKYGRSFDLDTEELIKYSQAKDDIFSGFMGLPKKPKEFFDPLYRAYETKMGETEARNAGDRIDFTMDERFKATPESTEDVPRSEQWGFPRYAEGGLVSKNAMSDYFMASSGQMSEMEFVGKHKMSTKEFEDRFESENNVDISGAEDIKEIIGKPKGNDMNKQMSFFNEGGMASPRVDPVSGNEVPLGSRPEEVRDDIDAKLSEGEYVVPADVVRFFGVNFFEQLRDKAKNGLQEMAADDRIGGAPAPQQGTVIAPEDMQAITQMAEGGLVDSTNINGIIDRVVEAAKTNPELQGIFQKRGIMMAEGGLVGDLPSADEAAQSTFDPNQWSTVGANMGGASGSGYGYKQYYSPEGVPMMVLLINGLPAQTIPEGYTTTKPPEVKPSSTAEQRTGQDSPGFSGGAPGGAGSGSLFNPLGNLDFSDPSSVSKDISKRLSGGTNFSGAGSAVGGLGGALIGGGISAYGKFRDIAVANAALRVAEDKGDLALAEDLAEQIRAAEEDFGLSGLARPEWFDGSQLYEDYQKNQGINPETGEPLKASERAGRFSPDTGSRTGSGGMSTAGTTARSTAGTTARSGGGSESPRSTTGSRSSETFASQTQAVREAGMSQPAGGMSGTQMTAGAEVGSGPGGSNYAGPMNKGGLVARRYKK